MRNSNNHQCHTAARHTAYQPSEHLEIQCKLYKKAHLTEKYWRIFWGENRRLEHKQNNKNKCHDKIQTADQERRQERGIKWQAWDSRQEGNIRHLQLPFRVSNTVTAQAAKTGRTQNLNKKHRCINTLIWTYILTDTHASNTYNIRTQNTHHNN